MGTISLILAGVFIAAAVFLLVRTIMGEQLSLEDQERLGIGLAKKEFPSPILKIIYPVVLRILPSVIGWKIDKSREEIKKKLSSAGLRETFTRQERIKREMPFVVDLLTLCVEAGLDFGGAMAKVVEKGQPGPLRTEFEIILKEIQLGAMRSEALRNMGNRIGLKEVSSFVSILITAERMGSPVGDVLRAQSDSIRHERYMAAESMGGKAATKVLIPMVLFILPAVFIAIAGPMILKKIYPNR